MMNFLRIAVLVLIISSLLTPNLTQAATTSTSTQQSIQAEWDYLGREAADLDGHWSERVFQWAIHQRMIDGYPDGSYQPDQPIKEAEFLKMFYRAYGAALPESREEGWDWTEGPYLLAKMWNHPVSGSNIPINRKQAAELIAAASGVHFIGDDAIIYLLGHSLSAGKTAPTLEGFGGNDFLTRAEAVQWVRTLKLKGMLSIKKRPDQPTDRQLLPPLPAIASKELEDFVLKPVDMKDFAFIDNQQNQIYGLGSKRETIEERFGTSSDALQMKSYKSGLRVHYTPDGLMDAWAWSLDDGELEAFRTNKGLILGECTLFDVLETYGTAGNDGSGIATYVHELIDGKLVPRASRFEVEDPNQAFVISMIIDEEKLKVNFFHVATYHFAFPDR